MDKPAGPTSHDVVARARGLFGTRAVGHAGTLDPFATGLLVLLLGKATRLARWAGRHPKTYRAEIRLGVTTTTDDRTGDVLRNVEPGSWPDEAAVRGALAGLTGRQRQRPPAFSAKRVAGVRSYRLARRGVAAAPPEAEVLVRELELIAYRPPDLTIHAVVGPGTYLRAIGRDLGEVLGTGAHLTELRREAIGPWKVSDAHRLEDLTGREPLLPARALVADLPAVGLSAEDAASVRHGRTVPGDPGGQPEAALLEAGRLIAMAEAAPGGWHPTVVLEPPEGSDP